MDIRLCKLKTTRVILLKKCSQPLSSPLNVVKKVGRGKKKNRLMFLIMMNRSLYCVQAVCLGTPGSLVPVSPGIRCSHACTGPINVRIVASLRRRTQTHKKHMPACLLACLPACSPACLLVCLPAACFPALHACKYVCVDGCMSHIGQHSNHIVGDIFLCCD